MQPLASLLFAADNGLPRRGSRRVYDANRNRENLPSARVFMELHNVRLEIPENANLILGQAHFIKTAEDIYEVMVNTVPGAKFAVAFNEASGPCLTRIEANDDDLRRAATANAR